MTNTLETLLSLIRDGAAGPAELERARALVRVDERIPPELRDEVLGDPAEAEADAVGLLAVLGVDDGLIAAAIREESGSLFDGPEADPELDDGWEPIGRVLREGLIEAADGVEVADAVVRRLPNAGFVWGPVLIEAVASEAGTAEVTDGVLAALELGAEAPIRAAVEAEAGGIDVIAAVMAALASELPLVAQPPVAEAVRAEAGPIDLVAPVMASIAPEPARTEPVRTEPVQLPKPANDNRGWSFGGVVLAAVALLALAVGRLATPLSGVAEPGLTFANASDVVVEDLSYSDNVQVFQTEGGQGAVILWLDEEA